MSGQYFEAQPQARSTPRSVTLTLPDLTMRLTTDRGVFSTDGIDAGTKFLLLDAPAPTPDVRVAVDLGCGYGPIALALAHRVPAATVHAVDVNQRAVELCTSNAKANELANVTASLVTADAPFGAVPADVAIDLIWSNPPIRIGKAALHELLEGWLGRLAPNGRAVLVVQKHLGADSLQRWLDGQGHPCTRVASRSSYRLLDVRHRGTA